MRANRTITNRSIMCTAALLGASGVALGAWGAHGLQGLLEGGVESSAAMLAAWDTAVLYQLVHALSVLLLGLWAFHNPSRWLIVAAWLMVAGVCLFSGSLYLLVLGGPGWLGPVTPIGGTLMIVGWLCAAWAALSSAEVRPG